MSWTTMERKVVEAEGDARGGGNDRERTWKLENLGSRGDSDFRRFC
jgi:hypothetical protein